MFAYNYLRDVNSDVNPYSNNTIEFKPFQVIICFTKPLLPKFNQTNRFAFVKPDN